MPPTTLKLPVELKRRIQALAQQTGKSAHAFMLEALERETERAEQRQSFVDDALAGRADFAQTGLGHDARDVHAYLHARATGSKPARPKATRWRG